MKPPSISQAYAMIRLLKKRAAKGDGEKIAQLETLITEARDKEAALAVEKYFTK